jgi:hypothetical protein
VRGRISGLLLPDEVRLILRAIDDLACVSLGIIPPGCTVNDVLARSDEADRLADDIAQRLVWADAEIAAEHFQTRDWLVDEITARLPDQEPAK